MINQNVGAKTVINGLGVEIIQPASAPAGEKFIQLSYPPWLSFEEAYNFKKYVIKAISWAKSKPAKPIKEEDHLVYCQQWIESEAGWGQRPDGWTAHLTLEDCKNYISDYWKREKASNPSGETPNCYSRPSGEPYLIIIKTSFLKKIEGFNGLWGDNNSGPSPATAEQIRAMVDAARKSSKKIKSAFETAAGKVEANRIESDRAVRAEIAKKIRPRRAALIK